MISSLSMRKTLLIFLILNVSICVEIDKIVSDVIINESGNDTQKIRSNQTTFTVIQGKAKTDDNTLKFTLPEKQNERIADQQLIADVEQIVAQGDELLQPNTTTPSHPYLTDKFIHLDDSNYEQMETQKASTIAIHQTVVSQEVTMQLATQTAKPKSFELDHKVTTEVPQMDESYVQMNSDSTDIPVDDLNLTKSTEPVISPEPERLEDEINDVPQTSTEESDIIIKETVDEPVSDIPDFDVTEFPKTNASDLTEQDSDEKYVTNSSNSIVSPLIESTTPTSVTENSLHAGQEPVIIIKNTNRARCNQQPNIHMCESTTEQSNDNNQTQLTWYYDAVDMSCHFTSDCITNDNAFSTEQECLDECGLKNDASRCLSPPKAGYFHCSSQDQMRARRPILMVFFDKIVGKCRWFTYYGCGGTTNRFTSTAECEKTCNNQIASQIFQVAHDLCRIPPDLDHQKSWININEPSSLNISSETNITMIQPEPLLVGNLTFTELARLEPECPNQGQYESRWFMNPELNKCQEFVFSQCGGSSNNFLTRMDCEQFCGIKIEDNSDVCKLQPSVGDCTESQTMWYYDPDPMNSLDPSKLDQNGGSCKMFNYSGCGGTANRFPTKELCKQTCMIQLEASETMNMDDLGIENHREIRTKESGGNLPIGNQTVTKVNEAGLEKSSDLAQAKEVPNSKDDFVLLSIDVEPCRREPIFGNCKPLGCLDTDSGSCNYLNFHRWFFNVHTSNCELFNYSGCGASENTFDDAQSCQAACKSRIVRPDRDRRCDSNPHSKQCYKLTVSGAPQEDEEENSIAFHFSVGSATCRAFHLNARRPECDIKSYFANGQECLRACVKSSPTERHLQNRCFARKTRTNWHCTSEEEKVFRWSFLPELNQCVRFSQCSSIKQRMEQPGNNFASRSACEITCMPRSFEDVCQLPKDVGSCNDLQTRYYYDTKTSKCRVFLYGGCLGNSNRFISREECELACGEFSRQIFYRNQTAPAQSDSKSISSKTKSSDEPPPLSAKVFERMNQITQHHMDHYPWEPCLDRHGYGTCLSSNGFLDYLSTEYPQTKLTRYFYDRRLGQCQPFTYSGCGASGNHFDTMDDCKTVCENRLRNPKITRCQNTKPVEHCPGSNIRAWSFNNSIGDCYSFEICSSRNDHNWTYTFRLKRTSQWLGVWQMKSGVLPPGVYATRSACQYHCLPKPPRGTDAQNICHMNPIVSVPFGCNAMVTRWYFEPRESRCRSYITCPQYGNNFPSQKACQEICTPTNPLDVCRLPRDHGGCTKFVNRWYYDKQKRSCLPFLYGGCFGNSNRFLTKAECDSFCTARDICRLPLQKNSSDPTYPQRYYFDQSKNLCISFRFTGLLAHGNNFPSLDACNQNCIHVPDVDVIASPDSVNKIDDNFKSNDAKKLAGSDYSDELDLGILSDDPKLDNLTVPVNFQVKESVISSSPLCSAFSSQKWFAYLEQKLVCDSEDIVHELGYRFRRMNSKSDAKGFDSSGGICEPTLVPSCLSHPPLSSRIRLLGGIFKTREECETKCLMKNRRKRSIPMLADDQQATELKETIKKMIQKRNIFETNRNHGNTTCWESESNSRKIYSKWPCSDSDRPPLVQQLEGQNVKLTCWIRSDNKPRVFWISPLKSNISHSTRITQYPMHKNIWQSDFHIDSLNSNTHNGIWRCQVQEAVVLEEASILVYTVKMNQLTSPDGGVLWMHCNIPGDVVNSVAWMRNGSSNVSYYSNKPDLIISNSNRLKHSGYWICEYEDTKTLNRVQTDPIHVHVQEPIRAN